jgi:hypothetical protein
MVRPGRIALAHHDTGQVNQFPAVTTYFASGVAVDSTTHRALIPSNDSFGMYDLAGQTGTAVTFAGSGYQHPAADAPHGKFLLQEVAPPDFFGNAPNNNAMSAIDLVDETATCCSEHSSSTSSTSTCSTWAATSR